MAEKKGVGGPRFNGQLEHIDESLHLFLRFGHSLVRPDFTLMTSGRAEKERIRLRDHFHNPDIMMK